MKDNFKYMLSNWLKWDKKSLKFFFPLGISISAAAVSYGVYTESND